MTFPVFCQHRDVSGDLTRRNLENHFFFFDCVTISPIFLNISVSRNDHMGCPLPAECHIILNSKRQ